MSQKCATIGVIVGRDLVGDALIKLPFLWALRNAYPQAKIHWITSQGPTAYGGILREAARTLIDQVHEKPQWINGQFSPFTLKRTRLQGTSSWSQAPYFDVLIDTRNRWHDALVAHQLPHGLFLAMAARYLFSDRSPPVFAPRPPHLVDRLLQMVELAAGYMPSSTGSLFVPGTLLDQARKILPKGKTYVGLAPGAGNAIKIWPRYKFEKLATLQAAKGYVPVFILGPQELGWFDELVATIPAALFPLQDYDSWGTAQLTIDHTLAIARLLDVAVANDSGVGHMLAAANCPLVSLFGPTSPEKLAPRVTRGKIIRAQSFSSDKMKAIMWESVDTAVDDILRLAVSSTGATP
jgi:ADP-heptose:LPS heptosyltransferase